MTSLYSSTPQRAQGSVPRFTAETKVKWRTACWVSFIVTVTSCLTEEACGRKVRSGSWTQRTPTWQRVRAAGCELLTRHHGQDAA